MIKSLIFDILLLKILFSAYNFFIFIHMLQWTSSKLFFFIIDFLEEILKENKIYW